MSVDQGKALVAARADLETQILNGDVTAQMNQTTRRAQRVRPLAAQYDTAPKGSAERHRLALEMCRIAVEVCSIASLTGQHNGVDPKLLRRLLAVGSHGQSDAQVHERAAKDVGVLIQTLAHASSATPVPSAHQSALMFVDALPPNFAHVFPDLERRVALLREQLHQRSASRPASTAGATAVSTATVAPTTTGAAPHITVAEVEACFRRAGLAPQPPKQFGASNGGASATAILAKFPDGNGLGIILADSPRTATSIEHHIRMNGGLAELAPDGTTVIAFSAANGLPSPSPSDFTTAHQCGP